MTPTAPQHRAGSPASTLAAAALLLAATACQSDGSESADSCTGLSHDLLNYLVDGHDFNTNESGDFPYQESPTEDTWGCTIEVNGENAINFVGGTHADRTPPSPSSSPEYFTYRGGTGFSEAHEGVWICGNIDIAGVSARDPFPEEKMAAALIALAQETGCRMEPEEQ